MLLPPLVRVSAPGRLLVVLPAPASEPMVSLKPRRSKTAPALTVTALAAGTASALPSRSVPALMVVTPL